MIHPETVALRFARVMQGFSYNNNPCPGMPARDENLGLLLSFGVGMAALEQTPPAAVLGYAIFVVNEKFASYAQN
jgi:hypothetical protein